jgi:hypothetical protein
VRTGFIRAIKKLPQIASVKLNS